MAIGIGWRVSVVDSFLIIDYYPTQERKLDDVTTLHKKKHFYLLPMFVSGVTDATIPIWTREQADLFVDSRKPLFSRRRMMTACCVATSLFRSRRQVALRLSLL